MQTSRRAFLGQLMVVAVAGSVLVGNRAEAAKKKKKTVRPLSKKGNASELPVVKSVGGNSIRVGDKFYVLSDFADVVVNGEKASLKDVKVGMQVMVTGGIKKAGDTSKDTIYKATRIVARSDNQLQNKAKAANKKAAEAARKANQRNNSKKRK